MTDENNNIPVENNDQVSDENAATESPVDVNNSVESSAPSTPPSTPPSNPPQASVPPSRPEPDDYEEDLGDRLERLGGEPAPVITPEEFARLQKAGQVHIDSRGRVRTARRSEAEAGVSLRKRRAWYAR
ncbi:hypothetical protein G4Y79_21740 [Phototrophicus methaneseepsis]|uniref:Uncharacterized protein n=1 Tax=Phototrophicus methaneseepsis TaxID=2710758 RepID=A0A7S8ID73_9CHLR|nr:hypothetical protein [Phototrophicus methaneseepsis]QPC82275.1 hypothetical protein G4Y79_21740 [Phototrophicus methaneseepsis]